MLLVLNMLRVQNTPELHRVLIMPEYAGICVNIVKSASMAFCFTFLHCNTLSNGTIDCFIGEKKFVFFYRS